MKLSVLVLLISLFIAGAVAAEPLTREQIVAARAATLSRILALLEERYATGGVDDHTLISARIELAQFRRDSATDQQTKITQQMVIVDQFQQIVYGIKAKMKAGLRSELDELRATAELLAAQQKLIEMKAGG